jgi:enoyl-[acyl-carrier protein] reductase II
LSFFITELLGIKYPIFQGGMAWISEANLAAAVSNAGGLGIIAAGNAPAEYVKEQIRKAKELTNKPFGVNIMLLSPYAAEVAQVVADERVEVVTTGAGDPSKFMTLFKQAGVKVVSVVPSSAIARRMERAGVDAVVAEGMESGGHIGKLTTMALVPQVVDAVSIPVIAAGGIADRRGVAAAFALGAVGVQVGTRFLAANECTVHENYKNAVLAAKDIDTVITGQITGHPVRCIKNTLTRSLEALEKEFTNTDDGAEKFEAASVGALRLAAVEGNVKGGSVMAGQIAGLVKKEQTAAEIVEDLAQGLPKL